jgi:hypothetical protein
MTCKGSWSSRTQASGVSNAGLASLGSGRLARGGGAPQRGRGWGELWEPGEPAEPKKLAFAGNIDYGPPNVELHVPAEQGLGGKRARALTDIWEDEHSLRFLRGNGLDPAWPEKEQERVPGATVVPVLLLRQRGVDPHNDEREGQGNPCSGTAAQPRQGGARLHGALGREADGAPAQEDVLVGGHVRRRPERSGGVSVLSVTGPRPALS